LQSHSDVQFVLKNAPRLNKVVAATAISFALWDGANRALLQFTEPTDGHEIASGYRGDCALIVVSRLALLLGADPKLISFQSMYARLKCDATVSVLTERLKAEALIPKAVVDNAEYSIRRFLEICRSLDWQDLHGRLIHFRNRGVAHLTPEKISKRVSYAELKSLVIAAIKMGECLAALCENEVSFRKGRIARME
jgi:hypothetical protein